RLEGGEMTAVQKPKRIIRTGPLVAGFALSKLSFLHPLLPPRVRYQLPTSWSLHMVRTFLGSQRKRIYTDVYTRLKLPESMKPRVESPSAYRMTEQEIESFWQKGYSGPHTLMTPAEMGALQDRIWQLWEKPSSTYPLGSYEYAGSQDSVVAEGEMSNEEL